jgi:Aldo/keto reductase family
MPRFQPENLPHNLELVAQLRELAKVEACTPAQLALAWVLSRGRYIVPIAGTSHHRLLEENAAAVDIPISSATVEALERIFRPGAAAGARYPICSQARSASERALTLFGIVVGPVYRPGNDATIRGSDRPCARAEELGKDSHNSFPRNA